MAALIIGGDRIDTYKDFLASQGIDSNRRLKIAHSFKDAHPEAVKRWS